MKETWRRRTEESSVRLRTENCARKIAVVPFKHTEWFQQRYEGYSQIWKKRCSTM